MEISANSSTFSTDFNHNHPNSESSTAFVYPRMPREAVEKKQQLLYKSTKPHHSLSCHSFQGISPITSVYGITDKSCILVHVKECNQSQS